MDIFQTLALRYTSCSMLVELTKVLAKLPLLVDAEVLLIPEEHHTTRSNQSGKVVLDWSRA